MEGPRIESEWKVSAPVPVDGKVVFTAPDTSAVHCLNLRTGKLIWKHNRGDDLYLAGVFNGKVILVGKRTCQALNLGDGKQMWRLETGVPSGQGIAGGNIYYLPLETGAQSKEPEVYAIDIDKGIIVAHSKSRNKEVPGNLIFYKNMVLSQTATHITAYPQSQAKLQENDDALKKKP